MPDALSSILDVVGLAVRHRGEIEADESGSWRVVLHAADGDVVGGPAPGGGEPGVWVATRTEPLWVSCGDELESLGRGEVALITPRAGEVVAVSTRWDATEPPPDPDADPVALMLGVRPGSGVLHGTFRSGRLGAETIGLPRMQVARESTGVRALTHPALELLDVTARQSASVGLHDALAESVVRIALHTWRPPSLRDHSLRAAIEHILDAPLAQPLRVADLPRPPGCSERTLHRRFLEATGLSPIAFARWWWSVRVRARLDRDEDRSTVATSSGCRDVHDLDRRLRRAAAAGPPAPRVVDDRPVFL